MQIAFGRVRRKTSPAAARFVSTNFYASPYINYTIYFQIRQVSGAKNHHCRFHCVFSAFRTVGL